jgi:hypothetical protein
MGENISQKPAASIFSAKISVKEPTQPSVERILRALPSG